MDSEYTVKLRSIVNKYGSKTPSELDWKITAPDKYTAERRAKSEASNMFGNLFKALSCAELAHEACPPTKPLYDPKSYVDANVVFLDLETTGLNPKKEAIIQIAMVPKASGEHDVGDGYQSYIDPQGVFNAAHEINKIGEDKLAGAPSLADYWGDVMVPLLKEADLIVCHNRCFDMEMLLANIRRAGIEVDPWLWPPVFCTKEMASKVVGGSSNQTRLYMVASHYGYMTFDHHEAMSDALATAFIFGKMINKGSPISELMDICDRGL